MILREGWSAAESWGVWAEGLTSQAQWVATAQTDVQMLVEAFPHYVPGEPQQVVIMFNGKPLTKHLWTTSEPWSDIIPIPGAWLRIGWNEIQFAYTYAKKPIDVTGGANPDQRPLSVGFSRLQIVRP